MTKAARGLDLRYYAAMTSAAAVAAVLGSAAAYTAQHLAFLPDLLVRIAVLLVGVNLLGAAFIYRPVRRFLAGGADAESLPARRIRDLPALSGLWIFALTTFSLMGHAAVVHGSWADLAQSPPGVLLGMLLHITVFAAYLGLYTYFLTIDYTISLRKRLWKRGVALPPRQGKLVHRLIAAFVAVAAAPVLITLSDKWVQPVAPDMPMGMAALARHHHKYMAQTLEMDVLGALVLTTIVVIFVARGLARPVRLLLDAMQRVDRGDLTTKAPVVSDDELGLLTQRFNHMLVGLQERERMRRTFGRFVPESVASVLLADEGAIAPQEREASVLFTDIERFTDIAASLGPRDVLHLLNGYFAELARIIHRHGGVITQFQGDAVLACFNLPVGDPDHARHALQAALEIQKQLGEIVFNGDVRLHTRIGISTGLVVGGIVGGGDRLGYTVHGDTVNLAARLEALNKELDTRILISARTAELVCEHHPLRDRGSTRLRGFKVPVQTFEPLVTGNATVIGEA